MASFSGLIDGPALILPATFRGLPRQIFLLGLCDHRSPHIRVSGRLSGYHAVLVLPKSTLLFSATFGNIGLHQKRKIALTQ